MRIFFSQITLETFEKNKGVDFQKKNVHKFHDISIFILFRMVTENNELWRLYDKILFIFKLAHPKILFHL